MHAANTLRTKTDNNTDIDIDNNNNNVHARPRLFKGEIRSLSRTPWSLNEAPLQPFTFA